MRINKKIRQAVLFATLVTFVTVSSGAAMALHLAGEHHKKHDSEHCRICQQLFAVNKNCLVEEDVLIVDYAQFCDTIRFHIHIINSISSYDSAEARAPPQQQLG